MGRKTRNTASCESVTGRYVECIQVGKEQVIIEVRPSFLEIGNEPRNNKWMEPRHWIELYGILLESANAHIKSSEKFHDPRKAQSSLLKVLYQFEKRARCYQKLLTTYEYHSKYPLLTLTSNDGFLGVEPYCYVLVAAVHPCESDVVGFDDFPTYWQTKSQTARGHSRSEQNTAQPLTSHSKIKKEDIKNGFEASSSQEKDRAQKLVLPRAEDKTEVPDNGTKSEDESPTSSTFQKPIYDDLTTETDHSDDTSASGASPLWPKDELEALVVNESNLPSSLDLSSPDMFGSCTSVENDEIHQQTTGGCSIKHFNLRENKRSSSSSEEEDSQLNVHDGKNVPKHELEAENSLTLLNPSYAKNKYKRILVPSQSSGAEGSVEIEDDLTSYPFRNVTQRKNSDGAVNTRSDAHKSKLMLKCTKQTKSNYFDPERKYEGDKVVAITDMSPESSPRKPIDELHETNKNMKTVETDSESEVMFVNQMPPVTDDQRKLFMLHELRGGAKKVDEDTPVKDTTDACKPGNVESPIACEGENNVPNELTHICNAEATGPVQPVLASFESDSEEDLTSLKKPYKRQRTFSKFVCERKTDKCSSTMLNESLQSPTKHKIDWSDKNLSESMQSADSGSGVEPQAVGCTPPSRLRKRNIFGNTKRVEEEVVTSIIEPSSLPTANSAQNLEKETSVKSPRKKAGGSKLCDKQSATQSVQQRVQRCSPRKVGVVCYSQEDDNKQNLESCEVVTKRVSPKKKPKREIVVEEEVQTGLDKLTENQAKLLALYDMSGLKRNAGDNRDSTKKQASLKNTKTGARGKNRKGSDAQKRVRKSKGSKEKKGPNDASHNQITDYFGASKKKPDVASTSTSDTKSRLLEEERIESLCKGMLNSDDDNDSSDSNGSALLADKCQRPQSQESDKENARYISIIGNLSLDKITKSFKKNKSDLHGIFKERIPCERHTLYKAGEKERNGLRYSTSTNPFSDKQLSHMMSLLINAFCQDNAVHFVDYMWKVLIPELANRVFMDEFDLGYEESLKKIYELYIFSNQDSDLES